MKTTKNMKQMYLTAIIGLMIAGFAGCKKSENPDETVKTSWFDGTITAQVRYGDEYNDLVKRVAAVRNKVILASGIYADGGFTLKLPQIVDKNNLREISFQWLGGDIFVSDTNAQTLTLMFITAYSSSSGSFDDEDLVRDFFLHKASQFDNNAPPGTTMIGGIDAWFMYIDRDVTVTGSGKYGSNNATYSLFLKKGWNIVYLIPIIEIMHDREISFEFLYSTTPIDGMQWY